MGAHSVEATLYTLLTHALLDRALSDELPGERGEAAWRYAQSLLQFEANVAWLWSRPEAAPVWDDVRTQRIERRSDLLSAALSDAVAEGRRRWGDGLSTWRWGEVRPFALRHLFTGSEGGLLGAILDAGPLELPGGTETPFKQQFPRSDREHMHPAVGPVARITVDMADPWSAIYTFAGGESGWPLSDRYANLLEDWGSGRGRPLTPRPSSEDVRVRLIPGSAR
jgi:penicillin amidase